jgi:NTP pyrophosphatase (non-canonical NTP hydrolase)
LDLSSDIDCDRVGIWIYFGRREILMDKLVRCPQCEDYMIKEKYTKTIEVLCKEAYETATSKGWHDDPRSFGEFISLVHAEVSEALEADRRNEGKERIAEELADVLIRIFDGAIEFGLDIETAVLTKMSFNKTRSYKHGNKKY